MKKGSCLPNIFSQVIYSGGYSDGEPPLPIPNREAKPVIADGTARPGGRVGSRRALKESSDEGSSGDSFSCLQVCEEAHQLPTPYVHAGIAVGCSCCRCMFESVLVMRLSTPPVSTQVSLRPVPVAGLCGPGVTCFPVGLPSGAGGQVYLSWLYPPYGHVCDDRLRFDPLDRSMWP